MESHEIAKFVNSFNTVAAVVMVLFAVCGIFSIAGKKLDWKFFRGKMFFPAFCAASLAAFAVETVYFNFEPYLKFFADSEIYTTHVSADNPNALLTSEGTLADIVADQNGASGIRFKNLNRRVTSVFADVEFVGNSETAEMFIEWMDEGNIFGYTKTLYKHLSRENYAPIQSQGKISELKIIFKGHGEGSISISSVALNKRIPFYFSGLRLCVVSFLIFAFIILLNKKLRSQTAYYLFEYKFDSANTKQNLIYAFFVLLLVVFSWLCLYTTPPTTTFLTKEPVNMQYNVYLVDALINGRTWLDYGSPEKLLNAERPYDINWKNANGYRMNVDWMFDWPWYKGKYYSYFGVVPAVILYVPYKLITGSYLSYSGGIFLFTAIIIVLSAILWRFLVKKYMPNSQAVFYFLSFLTIFFASNIHYMLRQPSVYTLAQTSGVMFAIAGILLLFKSTENKKINRLKLFFACLCFALVVGCRPNMIFVSFLVPAVLWKHKSWKLLLFVMIPYTIVAIPLCIYNYIRFDSIFEFGSSYMLTSIDMAKLDLLNPFGKAIRAFVSGAYYFFLPNRYSLHFPFITQTLQIKHDFGFSIQHNYGTGGIINFPIAFCLFYLFNNRFREDKFKIFGLISVSLIIAFILIYVTSSVGVMGRYMFDFTIFIIIPSLFCAYYWCNAQSDNADLYRIKMKIAYVLLAVSIFVGLFLFVTGINIHSSRDPVLYRYLEYSLGFIRS